MKFIELTVDDNKGSKILINPDHIISVCSDTLTGITNIMIPMHIIQVLESYTTVKGMITPH